MTLAERVMSKCVRVGDCLVWSGANTHKDKKGYGQVTLPGGGRHAMTHRIVYEHFFGPIPAGLCIDHVRSRGCRFRTCCEPSHLEVVTQRENILRGDANAAKNVLKTHCLNGHALTPENLTNYSVKRGRRNCRICQAELNRAYRKRLSEREAS